MTMSHNGLTKLVEECGEVTQRAAKWIAFEHSQIHPDGTNLKLELEKEIGDVIAAIKLVIVTKDLDEEFINSRSDEKLSIFSEWHSDPEN